MGFVLAATFFIPFLLLWFYSARLAVLFLVFLRTTIDIVGPFFPLWGEESKNAFELQEVASLAFLFLAFFTVLHLTFVRRIVWENYAKVGFAFVCLLLIVGFRTGMSGIGESLRAATWVLLVILLPHFIRGPRDLCLFIKVGFVATLLPPLGGLYSLMTGYKVGEYYGQMLGGLYGLKDLQGWNLSPPNLSILMMCLVGFPVVMLVWQKRFSLQQCVLSAFLIFYTYVVYRTFCRGGLLGLAVFVSGYFLFINPTRKRLVGAGLIFVVIWFLTIKMGLLAIRTQDFDFAALQGESSIFQRFSIWVFTINGWWDSNWIYKLFGHGLDTVRLITWNKSAHNDFIEMLYSAGLLTLALYITFLTLIFKKMNNLRRQYSDFLPLKQLTTVGLCLFAAALIPSNTLRFLYSLSWMTYVGTFYGLVLSLGRGTKENWVSGWSS